MDEQERERLKYLLLGLYFRKGVGEKTITLIYDLTSSLGPVVEKWSFEELQYYFRRLPKHRLKQLFHILTDWRNLLNEGREISNKLSKKGIQYFLRIELPERYHFAKWLFSQGNFSAYKNSTKPFVAIVGTRHPQGSYVQTIENLLASLQRLNPVIVSGLAPGIDQAAHEIAIEYRLPTIAVLGYGIEHRDISRKTTTVRNRIIESGGTVLSQFMPRVWASARRFLDRNYAIAWLSDAIIPVQGKVPSGTFSTVVKAMKLGKPILCPLTRQNEEIVTFLREQKYSNLHVGPEGEAGSVIAEILQGNRNTLTTAAEQSTPSRGEQLSLLFPK